MESHVVEEESRRSELDVLNFVFLAPLDVLDHLGSVGIETFTLGDKVSLVHPVTVDELGDVVTDVVRADNDTALTFTDFVLFNVFHGTSHRRAGRTTAQEAFFADHLSRIFECFLVAYFEPLVNQGAIANSRNEIIPDTFYLVHSAWRLLLVQLCRLGKNRAVWVNTNDFDVRVLFFELSRNAGECATSASSNEYVINFSFALVPDLLASFLVMSDRIGRISILVQNMAIFHFFSESFSNSDMTVLVIECIFSRSPDDLSTQSLKNVDLFLTHLLGKTNYHFEALRSGGNRKADTRITGSRLNENIAGLDAASLDRIDDHSSADSVFDRTAWVEELALGE